MRIKIKKGFQLISILSKVIGGVMSIGTIVYGITYLGLSETWPELVLNMFYIACLVMMTLFFFGRIKSQPFYYWCTLFIGITVLLRDILFMPPLENYAIHLICLTLSVTLLVLLTYFYSRKDWIEYTKRNLWILLVIDIAIAGLYNYVIYLHPVNEYTSYLLTEIWIRPAIIFGLIACFGFDLKEVRGE